MGKEKSIRKSPSPSFRELPSFLRSFKKDLDARRKSKEKPIAAPDAVHQVADFLCRQRCIDFAQLFCSADTKRMRKAVEAVQIKYSKKIDKAKSKSRIKVSKELSAQIEELKDKIVRTVALNERESLRQEMRQKLAKLLRMNCVMKLDFRAMAAEHEVDPVQLAANFLAKYTTLHGLFKDSLAVLKNVQEQENWTDELQPEQVHRILEAEMPVRQFVICHLLQLGQLLLILHDCNEAAAGAGGIAQSSMTLQQLQRRLLPLYGIKQHDSEDKKQEKKKKKKSRQSKNDLLKRFITDPGLLELVEKRSLVTDTDKLVCRDCPCRRPFGRDLLLTEFVEGNSIPQVLSKLVQFIERHWIEVPEDPLVPNSKVEVCELVYQLQKNPNDQVEECLKQYNTSDYTERKQAVHLAAAALQKFFADLPRKPLSEKKLLSDEGFSLEETETACPSCKPCDVPVVKLILELASKAPHLMGKYGVPMCLVEEDSTHGLTPDQRCKKVMDALQLMMQRYCPYGEDME